MSTAARGRRPDPSPALRVACKDFSPAAGSTERSIQFAVIAVGPRQVHGGDLCGRLPLAIGIVASLLAVHPERSLAGMVADLTDARMLESLA
jgi:hypothetical protein